MAWRYLKSRKSTNAINIISWISAAGMAVGAFALIVVLSVFNGFEGLVTSLYNTFYPDLIIQPAEGKYFTPSSDWHRQISATEGVYACSYTLEENAYFKYAGKDFIGSIKGVDEQYLKVAQLRPYLIAGEWLINDTTQNYAVLGANIMVALGVAGERNLFPLTVIAPKKSSRSVIAPQDAFTQRDILPSGAFAIQQEFDSRYILAPLAFVRELLDEPGVTAIEIRLKSGASPEEVKKSLTAITGNDFIIKTKLEQNEVLFRVMKLERWAVIAILSFTLLIISFNMVGSLTMLVMDKKKDIAILKAMGANAQLVKHVFLCNGVLLGLVGSLIGLAAGLLLCLLQIQYGLVKLGSGGNSFVVDAYPVQLRMADFMLVLGIVTAISLLASWLPASRASRSVMEFR